jgi:hypothetical protein
LYWPLDREVNFVRGDFGDVSHLKMRVTARNKLKSAQHRAAIIMACWQQAELS